MRRRPALLGTALISLVMPALMPPAQARPSHVAAAKPPVSPPVPVNAGAYLTAVVATLTGDMEEAARSYRTALETDPQNTDLLRRALVYSIFAGDPVVVPLAEQHLRKENGHSLIAAMVLGNDAAKRGAWKDAISRYRMVPDTGFYDLLTPLLDAWCRAGAGEGAAAIADLNRMAASRPPVATFYLTHAALIAGYSNLTSSAGELLTRAAAASSGDDLLLTRTRAAWLWKDGRRDEARELIRKVVASDPVFALSGSDLQATISIPPVTTPQQGLAHAYLVIAFLLFEEARHAPQPAISQGAEDASFFMLHLALSLDPDLTIARLRLAEVENDRKHPEEALAILRASDPKSPFARVVRFRIALLETRAGQQDAAVKELQSIVAEVPDQILPLRVLASLQAEQKNYPDAVKTWTQAIDLARRQNVRDWVLYFGRAAAFEAQGKWAEAEADLQKARTFAPDEPMILNFLGYGWIQRGQHREEAVRLLRRAMMLDPDDVAIRDSLGWALVETGDIANGTRLLEEAVEKEPLDAEMNYHLGVAYWRAGRHVEAIDQWDVALQQKPDPEVEKKIRKALSDAGSKAH
ncbi:tetratricopeptide repeat protein [Acetobacter sp. AN02]|uniref:tetratricopeptide repeat protein n=1 Tax=Acetobacter sp. AN02 TaxID=2894186 RepID=UPI0024345C0A|nr:tetratricopeptide repeat protein [Acetobacter sp. AN02]MDG6094923.1 tetratricopeptide repeat protein [Acetobacter sp. AN02]